LLPLELLSLAEEYHDDISYHIAGGDRINNDIILRLAVIIDDTYREVNFTQLWQLTITGYITGAVPVGYCIYLHCNNVHPLLWPYTDTQCELYFNGIIKDASSLFYDLFLVHKRTFGSYLPMETFLNRNTDFHKLLSASSGLFAKGPKELLMEYASCLQKHQLAYTVIGERSPEYLDGNAVGKTGKTLEILFMDNNYVIAERFDFTKLS